NKILRACNAITIMFSKSARYKIFNFSVLIFGLSMSLYGLIYWIRIGYSFKGIFSFDTIGNPLHICFIGVVAVMYAVERFINGNDKK
ncbi:MAG: hypothetical protein AB2535_15720, partial [Candidatus Thiodiazotropha endolucinida]